MKMNPFRATATEIVHCQHTNAIYFTESLQRSYTNSYTFLIPEQNSRVLTRRWSSLNVTIAPATERYPNHAERHNSFSIWTARYSSMSILARYKSGSGSASYPTRCSQATSYNVYWPLHPRHLPFRTKFCTLELLSGSQVGFAQNIKATQSIYRICQRTYWQYWRIIVKSKKRQSQSA